MLCLRHGPVQSFRPTYSLLLLKQSKSRVTFCLPLQSNKIINYFQYIFSIQVFRLCTNLERRRLDANIINVFLCILYMAACCVWWYDRFRWPHGLRRRSAAFRLLTLRVRITPVVWMSVVSVVCCQVEVSATNWSLVQRSPTDCGASLCVI
jgi:hypothetical protein